jgi:anti-sigma regulatory factor (Ser/Thr protein kinase)
VSSPDTLLLELTSDASVLPGTRSRLSDWARGHGWDEDPAAQIVLAVDEALGNVIRHGYAGETTHKILLQAQVIQDGQIGEGVEIRVRDFGRQVNPDEIRGRDLHEVRRGGLGVHLIRHLMDFAEYSRAAGGGMLLIMRKYKAGRVSPPAGTGPR